MILAQETIASFGAQCHCWEAAYASKTDNDAFPTNKDKFIPFYNLPILAREETIVLFAEIGF